MPTAKEAEPTEMDERSTDGEAEGGSPRSASPSPSPRASSPSPPTLSIAAGGSTPAASTLTTVSNTESLVVEKTLECEDWKRKYMEEKRRNERMAREVGQRSGKESHTRLLTVEDLRKLIGDRGVAYVLPMLDKFRNEIWSEQKCMPGGFLEWKPHVECHCSYYFAVWAMTEFGGWPEGMEPVQVWTQWIVPGLVMSLSAWKAGTTRKFTTLIEGNYMSCLSYDIMTQLCLSRSNINPPSPVIYNADDSKNVLFDPDLDEYLGDFDVDRKEDVVKPTLELIDADVIREKYIRGQPREFCEMVHRFASRVNGRMSALTRALKDRNTPESKNYFKVISWSDVVYALLLFVIKGKLWKKRVKLLKAKADMTAAQEAAKAGGKKATNAKRKIAEIEQSGVLDKDKREYSFGRKGWLIGNRANDKKQGLTDVAVQFYKVVKKAMEEIDMSEWEAIWADYYPTIKGANSGFVPETRNSWEIDGEESGDGCLRIAGLNMPRINEFGMLAP